MTLALTATSRVAASLQRVTPHSAPESRIVPSGRAAGKEDFQSRAAPVSGEPLSSENAVLAQSETEPGADPNQLSEAEQEIVDDLRQRDREVRQHEQAHAAKGGPYASSPSYDTVRGPDGASYAVGGEVKIDVSPVRGDPEATIRKMEIVKRAALAPSEPSSQDRAVAAQADAQKAQAQLELRQQRAGEEGGVTENSKSPAGESAPAENRTGGLIDRYRQASELASEGNVSHGLAVTA